MSATDHQVGGTYYKDMIIGPTEFSMANGLDTCLSAIVKYVSRHMEKPRDEGVKDILKAIHYVHLRVELWPTGPKNSVYKTISAKRYCAYNPNIGPDEGSVINDVLSWGLRPALEGYPYTIEAKLHRILLLRYSYPPVTEPTTEKPDNVQS